MFLQAGSYHKSEIITNLKLLQAMFFFQYYFGVLTESIFNIIGFSI